MTAAIFLGGIMVGATLGIVLMCVLAVSKAADHDD
jgi:F0F1-type ATP synthase assembly protein I